ncbi:MAG: glycosyl hydrolase [Bacillota bacterium]
MSIAVAEGGTPAAVPDTELRHRPFDQEDVAAFREPSRVFHPETWFHFIGGNVAKPGITADLEAIAGAGVEGVQLFHGQFGGPWPGVEPQIKCLSERWDGAVRHVAEECRRLGLRFTMQNCPGWAMAGGPWITPDRAMRHLVWSRTDVTGGGNLSVALPLPSQEAWRDYRDVMVVAFPTPEGDTGKALTPASVRSNRPDLPWEKCLRSQDGGAIRLEPAGEPVWVEATFEQPVTLRTVEFPSVQGFNHEWCYDPGVTITVQAILPEGMREVSRRKMPASNFQGNRPISLACSEVPARTYRITIDHKHRMAFSYIQLFTAARQNNWEAEAAWVLGGLDRMPHPPQTKVAWVDPARIIDLTDKMDSQGKLRWTAPEGRWTVLRWGHVNTGKRNGPAPAEATGWECDKLSPTGAETHFAGYIGRLAAKDGPVGGGLLQGMLLDSWECETQTWTPGLEKQFSQLRGYSLKPWFPALAGYVVGDPETTVRFLRDWRGTINDLVVRNFFGRMAELGHENGLAISFETASGDVFPGDILEYYKHADVPMCEFWHPRSEAFVGSFEFKPVKPCVSAARIYGKPRVAAEAFTSFDLTWNEHPGMLKHIADIHFAEGVTHLVFHTYTHNPQMGFLPPGTSFGSGIGTPFLRGQTWWKHMPAFTAYLARCGYLLERGRPVSDVLWYLGDEQDHKPRQDAPFPAGYHYDYCNPDVLLNRLSVRDGMLVTPEGLSYRVLWLRNCPRMLPETLERMVSLVNAGAVLVGERPRGLATLSGGAEAEKRFRDAVQTLWGTEGRPPEAGTLKSVRLVGKGRVMEMALDTALARLGLGRDVEGDGVVWTHRQTDGADWYFVATRLQQGFRGTLRFRATGAVELWNPLTGDRTPAGVVRREGDTSLVALELPPSGSLFVVFRPGDRPALNRVVRVEHDGATVADAQVPRVVADGLQVMSATYGDLSDPSRCLNVTDKVRQDRARGINVIRANNAWAGGDPALQTRKKLLVVMQMPDGQKKRLEAWEGEPLSLAELVGAPRPACEVLDDGARLLAWEPGVYRATHEDGTTSTWKTRTPRSISLAGPWTLAFPAGWGGPAAVRVERLMSWTELSLPPEAQAFSGTATYTTEFTFELPAPGTRVELDLGCVQVIASVRINDEPAGSVWTSPYRLDITRLVKPGVNRLAVEVTNTWFNRLAYDAGLEEKARKTWTINGPAKGSALLPAGLLGPVVVHVGEILDANNRP